MAINFPNSPDLYEVYNDPVSKNSYIWNGDYWTGFTSSTSYKVSINLATIVVEDDSSPVGIVSTLDFADNLGVTFSAGVATVTGAGGIATGFSTTASINTTGIITASSFSGSGGSLTGLTGASAGIYGDSSVVPQISVDSTGRIIGISTIAISGGGGASLLNDLTDVVINGGSLTSGQVLKYDGSNWVNGTDLTGSGSGESYWVSNVSGINTTSNVGIGTTNPTSKLFVVGDANITGDVVIAGASFTTSTQTALVSSLPPENPTQGKLWYSSTFGRGFIYYDDGSSAQWVDLSPPITTPSSPSYWAQTSVGIHTLSNVGIGTTNPTSKLTVVGDADITGNVTIAGAPLSSYLQSTITVSSTPPVGPTQGKLWYSSNIGRGFVYYDDGTSAQWVDLSPTISIPVINYWGVTTAGIHTLSNVGIATTNPQTPLQVEKYGVKTGFGTFVAVSGAPTNIDTFAISSTDFKTAEYTLHVGFGTYIQAQKVLLMQNGSNAFIQEYAVMGEPDLGVSARASVSGGICSLQLVPKVGVTGIVTYRYYRSTLL